MLRLLSLTVVAQAPAGPPLPTHQAGVGGDVCPLRVCREAEDTHYCTVKVRRIPAFGTVPSSSGASSTRAWWLCVQLCTLKGGGQAHWTPCHRLGFASVPLLCRSQATCFRCPWLSTGTAAPCGSARVRSAGRARAVTSSTPRASPWATEGSPGASAACVACPLTYTYCLAIERRLSLHRPIASAALEAPHRAILTTPPSRRAPWWPTCLSNPSRLTA